ncbi:sulfite exporter TauE/SafE family protein [Salegentibacter sp.]|uniref:sulfite exporter TauE/SafE family protein n=1 Tax=Salegentibacter sp. TaxID=1903072 RepID=UPI003569932F
MLISALIFGLLGSFHCIGMCGPIAFLLPVDRENSLRKAGQVSLYHLGRIFSYALIGLLFGVIGKSFGLFGLQQQLSIAVGILMILVIFLPYKTFGKINGSGPVYRFISKVKSGLGQSLKKKTPDTFFTAGFLNGFLPCGLVYMAVFGAVASANALEGSLYMMLFGLGTVPMMTAAVYLGNFIGAGVRQKITKAVPVFVVIIGLLFIIRGMGLGIPYLSPIEMTPKITAVQSCH